jgi:hypothetical protein
MKISQIVKMIAEGFGAGFAGEMPSNRGKIVFSTFKR